ncbi:hypothetical protein CWO91_16600 [Bradyrhizobium genosp. SA-3]|uniref:endonuclease VII domain-containing protein n=1 Tax=Bradyrhizobium genosp. SA-3 TaxID=508868 RepID=UPI001029858B|nr:hypothetical protein CWO91_16600 [Bradyrhizobium genosp. SA-3]
MPPRRNKPYPSRTTAGRREYHLRKRYGITVRDRDELLRRQRGRCAGCRRARGWKKVVDHNHRTKKVRGILCHHCNLILGHAKDNANTLRRLACYLEK